MNGWPLTGREDELSRIDAALRQRRGVLLAGPAGTGKTRLLGAALAGAADAGASTMTIVGSRASEAIPLGCMSGLLATDPDAGDEPGGLVRARRAVKEAAKGAPLVLAVDDAHWLDDASIALIHQLIVSGEVTVLASIRNDEDVPSAVTALWKDGLLERVDVDPLGAAAVLELLEAALGGQVERSCAQRLAERCRGNALFLRELVEEAHRLDLVRKQDGVFVIADPPARSARLAELVAERIGELDDATRTALEIVALGEPVPLAVVDAITGTSGVEELEHRGLAVVAMDGLRTDVRLAHPLHGDVVRVQLPELRRRRTLQSLARALEATGTHRTGDRMRLALLRLDSGGSVDIDLLRAATREAYALYVGPVAERLAAAAHATEPSFESAQLLASILYERGNHAEQQRVLDDAERLAGDDMERAAVAGARAAGMFWGLADRAGAQDRLQRIEAAMTTDDARWTVRGTRALFESQAGDQRSALSLLDGCPPLLSLDARAHAQIALALAFALPGVGRGVEGIAVIDEALRRREQGEPVLTMYTVGLLAAARAMALVGLGELDDAESIVLVGYETALRSGDVSAQGFMSGVRGWVALHRGRLAEATRCYRDAAVAFRTTGHVGPCRWALGGLTFAAGLARDREVADEALRALDALGDHPGQLMEVAITRARAWAALASGDPEGARTALAAAVVLARSRGLPPEEAGALHDLVRLGRADADVAARLEELAAVCDGPFVQAMARHAAGAVGDDVSLLEQAGAAFERMGYVLKAAEATMGASEAAARAGDQRRATRLSRAAAALADRCETPGTPMLTSPDGPVPLTNREREVAVLAAAGLSSKLVADRLFLSSRTVDNHLARIYAKLGIAGRSELADALAADRG